VDVGMVMCDFFMCFDSGGVGKGFVVDFCVV